jgi:hypothetical protein
LRCVHRTHRQRAAQVLRGSAATLVVCVSMSTSLNAIVRSSSDPVSWRFSHRPGSFCRNRDALQADVQHVIAIVVKPPLLKNVPLLPKL